MLTRPLPMFGLGTVLLISAATGKYGVAGAVSAVGSFGYAFTSPRIARLVDTRGQRRVLLPLLTVFAVATALLIAAVEQWRKAIEKRFAFTLTLTVLGVATFWAQPNLVTLTCWIYLCGLTIAPTLIAGFSLLEAQAKPGRRTEAMSWLSSGIAVGVAVGASVVGFVIDAHGARLGCAFAALCGAASAATCLAGLRRLRPVDVSAPADARVWSQAPGVQLTGAVTAHD